MGYRDYVSEVQEPLPADNTFDAATDADLLIPLRDVRVQLVGGSECEVPSSEPHQCTRAPTDSCVSVQYAIDTALPPRVWRTSA